MISLDTNVLVRFLIETPDGETDQVRRARDVVARAEALGDRVHLTTTALVETVWVLERAYKIPRDKIAIAYERLLDTRLFDLASSAEVRQALSRYRAEPGDFADYLIGALSVAAGAMRVFTFDAALLRGSPFVEP